MCATEFPAPPEDLEFKLINSVIQGRLPIAALDTERFRYNVVKDRLRRRQHYWDKVLSHTVSASNSGILGNFKKWQDQLGIRSKIIISQDNNEETECDVSNILSKDGKKFLFPFDAAINFHLRIAKVYDEICLFEDIYSSDLSMHMSHEYWSQTFRVGYGNEYNIPIIEDGTNGMMYSVPLENKLDRWFFIASDIMYYSLGGSKLLDPFPVSRDLDSHEYANALKHMNKAIDCGLAFILFFKKSVLLQVIEKCCLGKDMDIHGLLHCENAPASKHPDGTEMYCLDGVNVPRKLIMDDDPITPEDIINVDNQWDRQRLLAKFGFENFFKAVKGEVIDSQKEEKGISELIRFRFDESYGEPDEIYCAKVICPSTGNEYLLRVPPSKSLREALGWTFGISEDKYFPVAET